MQTTRFDQMQDLPLRQDGQSRNELEVSQNLGAAAAEGAERDFADDEVVSEHSAFDEELA